MKKRTQIKLILIAACLLLFTLGLAACRQSGLTREDLAAEGYTYDVVIDLAGGTSGDGDRARSELHQFVKGGSLIVKPGTVTFSGDDPKRDGYTLGGYYRGTKAEDGAITYGEKWDFKKDKVTENLTLYAYWRENYKLVVHYGEGFAETYETAVSQNEDGVAGPVATPAISGRTVIAFYSDLQAAEQKDASKTVAFPHTPTELTAEHPVWEVWADTLEGNFKLVRTARDFSFYAGTNVYLMADIDFEGKTVTFPENYKGKFYGNGYTLSNFTVNRTSERRGDDYLGLFKRLTDGAYIEDVTFANFTLNVETLNANFNYEIGALAGLTQGTVTLKGVTLSGTLNCKLIKQGENNETTVTSFIGAPAEGFTQTGCDYSGVNIVYAEDEKQ